ncbi:hypothetical protein NE237_002696 [Protea cynaroides]|uniref:F-box protein n=1 Tax=Protea cynaroides TaxID=273540 RepID=A0A9Q0QRV5_9MAGN|nr:hypothetical protein NE237_002696 [Protea cynaroides]
MTKLMLSNSNGDEVDQADLYYCTDDCTDHILTEILIRLPLKPVLRCKCVSKRWFHLISDPCFRTSYVSHRRRRRSCCRRLIGFFKTPTNVSTYVCKFLPTITSSINDNKIEEEEESSQQVILEEGEDIISSLETSQGILKSFGYFMCHSNGLFLCSNINNMYYIYNPISKEYYQLPHPPKKQVNSTWKRPILGLVVAADYDQVCSGQLQFRYKVVRAEASRSNMDTRDLIEIETFFSDTGKWTESKVAVNVATYNHFSYNQLYARVIRGAIHWMSCLSIFVYDPNSIGEKHIEKIDPPPGSNSRPSIIGESSDGLLQLVALDKTHNFINVWVYQDSVNEESHQWSLRRKMLQVSPRPPSIGRNSFIPAVSLVALHPDNSEAVFINLNVAASMKLLETREEEEDLKQLKSTDMKAIFDLLALTNTQKQEVEKYRRALLVWIADFESQMNRSELKMES